MHWMNPFSDRDSELVQCRFAQARSEYAVRKEAAEAAVSEWGWFTAPPQDRRPHYFAWEQDKPGRRLKSEPASKTDRYLIGFDEQGEIVVERSYHTATTYGETFTVPWDDVVETAYFDHYDQHLISLGHFRYDTDGRMVRHIGYTPERGRCEIFQWSGPQLQRIEIWGRERDHVWPAVVHRLIWSPTGELLKTTSESPDTA